MMLYFPCINMNVITQDAYHPTTLSTREGKDEVGRERWYCPLSSPTKAYLSYANTLSVSEKAPDEEMGHKQQACSIISQPYYLKNTIILLTCRDGEGTLRGFNILPFSFNVQCVNAEEVHSPITTDEKWWNNITKMCIV